MVEKTHSISDLMKVVNGEMEPPACDTTLQVKINEASDGISRGTWTVDEKFVNGHGVAMGGFVSGAVDIVMAYAIASKIASDNKTFASINLDTTFHRPVTKGEVTISVTVERLGRTIAYMTATVEQNDKLVANTTSSVYII